MFSYWIKNRLGFSVVLCLSLTIAYVMVFVVPFSKNASQNELAQSIYRDTDVDYDIPSPTKTQLKDILSLDFVDEAFGYYITEASFDLRGDTIKNKLMISDCVEAIDITMFGADCAIESSNSEADYPLYIGQDFANENGLSIGDELMYGDFTLTVTRIVKPDTYRNCVLVMVSDGDLLELIESKSASYSGAYISVNDLTAADSYLRAYRPEGRLKDRSVFSSDDEYQIHYDAWSNASYYNEITSFEEKLDEVRLLDTSNIWIGSIAVIVLFVIINFILFVRKSERVYFKDKKSKRGISGYYIRTFVVDIVMCVITAVGSSYLYSMFSDSYMVQKVLSNAAIITLATILFSCAVCLIINLALARKICKGNNGIKA